MEEIYEKRQNDFLWSSYLDPATPGGKFAAGVVVSFSQAVPATQSYEILRERGSEGTMLSGEGSGSWSQRRRKRKSMGLF
jgi:hypothetical protein